jgi:molybdopterin converting factor small subunit
MRILFFAHLKNAARCASAEIHFGGEIDGGALWQRLLADYPDLKRYQPSVRLAKNNAYATAGTRFSDTDEVALIPPVSGG